MSQELISIAQARAEVLAATHPLEIEEVAIDQALDRVLAAELSAAGDVPPFASSAMDGYAVQAGPAGRRLPVVAEARAGVPSARALQAGEAIRISTGAAVPDGATAVIPQENAATLDGAIETREDVAPGQNIRAAAEDMARGATVLRAGVRLGSPELGAAVAAGAGTLPVRRRPVLSVLCTGDELRPPGELLNSGEIHNSNGPMLVAMAARLGALSAPARRVKDDRGTTVAELESALRSSDVVVISGGVSVGPHDHVKPALQELGTKQHFWGVALQPGKPTWFGTRARTLVFGLPGNPVSAAVTFSLFVSPALAALQGETQPRLLTPPRGELTVGVRRNPRREQALRVKLDLDERGPALVTPTGPQGSHIVTSLLGAGALALIPRGDGELPAGSVVDLWPLVR